MPRKDKCSQCGRPHVTPPREWFSQEVLADWPLTLFYDVTIRLEARRPRKVSLCAMCSAELILHGAAILYERMVEYTAKISGTRRTITNSILIPLSNEPRRRQTRRGKQT